MEEKTLAKEEKIETKDETKETFRIEHPIWVDKYPDGRIRFINITTEVSDSWFKDLENGACIVVHGYLPKPDDDVSVQVGVRRKL